jgi:Zn-dependent protease/CBS domain-containing protein
MGIISSLLLFVCVLLHEFSHSYTARRLGVTVTHITLFIFGGVSNMPEEPDSPRKDIIISAAGPACSAALFGVFFILSSMVSEGGAVKSILMYLTYINGALAIFNLLPGFPLDGGRILRDIVWIKTGNLPKAAHAASTVGKAVGMGLILLGILAFFQGSLVSGIWFVFIGLFMRAAAEQGYRQTSFQKELVDVKVSQIMTADPVCVPLDLPIPRLVEDYFYHYHHVAYPVVDGDKLLGMIDLKRIKLLKKEERETLTVGQVMTDLAPDITAAPQDQVTKVLQRLLSSPHGRLLVVENGNLKGIIARRDIMDLLQIKTELG